MPITKANQEDDEVPARPTLFHRLKVWAISEFGYWMIRAVGSTLRWEVEGWENYRAIRAAGKKVIYTFWHGRIFLGTYFWRRRGIVVMTSQHRDGDYIARMIRRFGYGAARGSSTRSAKRALAEMILEMRKGNDVAFTIDGPRGPCYVAKAGAVWLAARTGNAVFPFAPCARAKWVLKSWDRFEIPKPFTRALMLMGAPIWVKAGATEEELEQAQCALQKSLEETLARGDSYWDA